MTATRSRRTKPAPPPSAPIEPPLPHGLAVTPFDVAGEPLVVFSFEHAPAVRRALTRAENEIVLHLLDGRSNTEIARLRGRSPSTIANQVATIFKKLGVSSRLELARRW